MSHPQVEVERDGDKVTVTLSGLGTYEAMRLYDDMIRQATTEGEIVLVIPAGKAGDDAP